MSYTKTTWKDRNVQNPRTYNVVNNADGTITLNAAPGTVTEAGTPVLASSMNKIEQALYLTNNIFVATGSNGTYALTIAGISSLTDLVGIPIKVQIPDTEGGTLNINSYGAKNLYKNGNTAVTFKANGIYTWIWNGTNFIVQGEGGEIPKFNNLFKNGSFENDQNCYSNVGGNGMSISTTRAYHGTKSVKMSAENTDWQQLVNIPSGHIFYLTCMFYVVNSPSGAALFLKNKDGNSVASVKYANNSLLNQWQRVSIIFTSNDTGYLAGIGTYNAGASCEWYADGLMCLDLTDAFGAGNEPSKEEMDVMVMRTGKNLLDVDAIIARVNDASKAYITYKDGRQVLALDSANRAFKFDFKANTIYTIKAECRKEVAGAASGLFAIVYTDASVDYLVPATVTWTSVGLITASGKTIKEIQASYASGGNPCYFDVNTLQLEEGAAATSFEPYFKYGWWDSDLPELTADANVTANKMAAGSSGYSKGQLVVGSIPDFSADYTWKTPTLIETASGHVYAYAPKGFYGDLSGLDIADPNFISANIPQGISMFNLAGTNTNKKWKSGQFGDWSTGGVYHISLTFTPSMVVCIVGTQNYVSADRAKLNKSYILFGSGWGAMNGYFLDFPYFYAQSASFRIVTNGFDVYAGSQYYVDYLAIE